MHLFALLQAPILNALPRHVAEGAEDVMERSPKHTVYRFRSRWACVAVALLFWWTLLVMRYSHDNRPPQTTQQEPNHAASSSSDANYVERDDSELQQDGQYVDMASAANRSDCQGRYVFVYELDPYFNEDMVRHCDKLSMWTNWCPSVMNLGLGPPMENVDGVFSDSDWYTTNQFMLEQIFHNRMRRYKCLTQDSARAAAIFVPFYAGFEITTKLWHSNITERDAAPSRLQEFLSQQPSWRRFCGADHFLVGGRITWDFRRSSDEESDWGNKLFVLPGVENMTMLTIEASPWHANDEAIPYPTGFHPRSRAALVSWQERMRGTQRAALFSFVGAGRSGLRGSVRTKLMEQCVASRKCRLLDCKTTSCLRPHKLMSIFSHSVFCLQPPGDSYTRRSTFDAILAGCIPVFFHAHSIQYHWHLPSNHSSYCVLIPEAGVKNGSILIEDVLRAFSSSQVAAMRETVIQTIPRIVYADPGVGSVEGVEDAFDIAVQGVIDRINKKRETWHVNVASPRTEEAMLDQNSH